MASAPELMDRLEVGPDHLLNSATMKQWLGPSPVPLVQLRQRDADCQPASRRCPGRGAPRLEDTRPLRQKGRARYRDPRAEGYKPTKPADSAANEVPNTDEPTRLGFRVVYVFDSRQTEGPPLLNLVAQSLQGADVASAHLCDALLTLAVAEGLTVTLAATDCAAAQGFYGYDRRANAIIHVAADCGPNQVAQVLGHHLLGHGSHSHKRRRIVETEAESFGDIRCAAAAWPTESFALPYTAFWAADDTVEATRHASPGALTPVHDAAKASLKRLSRIPPP